MDFIMVSKLQGLGPCWAFPPVLPSGCARVWTIVPHVRRRVNSPTLPRYAWVVRFISLEQTSSLKVHFVKE
jgi:hypothetical protein